MQPYFLPYIGYFQLINTVDKYVLYDNIQYTKKGWINRNKFLQNNKELYFTIPLQKDSDYLNICKRNISDSFKRKKLIDKINFSYSKSPYFSEVYPIVVSIINYQNNNLFEYLYNSIIEICNYLNIDYLKIIVSSKVSIDHSFKSENKVIKICKKLECTNYINPIGGIDLYNNNNFRDNNIKLSFLKAKDISYDQFNSKFVPSLSILDVMMFNSKDVVKSFLNQYSIINP